MFRVTLFPRNIPNMINNRPTTAAIYKRSIENPPKAIRPSTAIDAVERRVSFSDQVDSHQYITTASLPSPSQKANNNYVNVVEKYRIPPKPPLVSLPALN